MGETEEQLGVTVKEEEENERLWKRKRLGKKEKLKGDREEEKWRKEYM